MIATYFDILSNLFHIFCALDSEMSYFLVMQLQCTGQVLLKESYNILTIHAEMCQI